MFALQVTEEDHGSGLLEPGPWEEYFVDFLRDAPEMTGDEPEDAEAETPKIYEPIPSFTALSERLSVFQQQYNDTIRGAAMDLVFFEVGLKKCWVVSTQGKSQTLESRKLNHII